MYQEGRKEKGLEGRGKERNERKGGKKGMRKKKERKVKGQNGMVCWERRRECVKIMKVLGLLIRRKTFFEPCCFLP